MTDFHYTKFILALIYLLIYKTCTAMQLSTFLLGAVGTGVNALDSSTCASFKGNCASGPKWKKPETTQCKAAQCEEEECCRIVGWIIDRTCWENYGFECSDNSPDKIDFCEQPHLHTFNCLYNMRVCRNSGYGLIGPRGNGAGEGTWTLKYVIQKEEEDPPTDSGLGARLSAVIKDNENRGTNYLFELEGAKLNTELSYISSTEPYKENRSLLKEVTHFEAAKLLSVEEAEAYEKDNGENVCLDQKCGDQCGEAKMCDRNGGCVDKPSDVLDNPCVEHGCGSKECGEECTQGDIMGVCNSKGECQLKNLKPVCGVESEGVSEIVPFLKRISRQIISSIFKNLKFLVFDFFKTTTTTTTTTKAKTEFIP